MKYVCQHWLLWQPKCSICMQCENPPMYSELRFAEIISFQNPPWWLFMMANLWERKKDKTSAASNLSMATNYICSIFKIGGEQMCLLNLVSVKAESFDRILIEKRFHSSPPIHITVSGEFVYGTWERKRVQFSLCLIIV